ncbi:hypothetical protein [Bacillus thuringiensis]|uniref:hypothetical protein n=1 Tax=Bacillus thuringiensis TaxID=1428 RepID=UPI000BFC8E85|nr:hypothetical protein [Bacillus thuringiensis]PGT90021.1 hypothetical protein COD17_09735 [Bacillus thuringiensis]
MNIKNELEFLHQVTLGLFNKKGISFDCCTRPFSKGGIQVKTLIVNDDSTGSGNYQRLEITYNTTGDTVYTKFSNNSLFEFVTKEVPKEEAHHYLTDLLNSPAGKENKEILWTDGEIDFYDVLETLADQMFTSKELFEFNAWKKSIYLHDALNVGYRDLENEYHVHGGVGSAPNYDGLHTITTNVEMGTKPNDGGTYLQVYKDIAENPTYPRGVYENATLEMFVQAVIEQYQGAWNRTK